MGAAKKAMSFLYRSWKFLLDLLGLATTAVYEGMPLGGLDNLLGHQP